MNSAGHRTEKKKNKQPFKSIYIYIKKTIATTERSSTETKNEHEQIKPTCYKDLQVMFSYTFVYVVLSNKFLPFIYFNLPITGGSMRDG